MRFGYIIAILILSGISSYLFRKLAVSKGYQARKAGRYPLVLGAFASLIALLLLAAVVIAGSMMPQFQSTLSVLYVAANWFILASLLAILHLAYRKMKDAPNVIEQSSKINQDGN